MYYNEEILKRYPTIRKAFANKPLKRLNVNGTSTICETDSSDPVFDGGFYAMHCKERFDLDTYEKLQSDTHT